VASLLFAIGFLAASLLVVGHLAGTVLGWVGLAAAGVLGVLSLRGLTAGEVSRMILTRHRWTAVWVVALGGAGLALGVIDIRDRAGGPFQVRAATRVEVRAPAAGFVREVHHDEGNYVSPGAPLVRLEVPDLAGRLAQKRADIRQVEARLRLLEEEVAEQRRRVARAEGWRDLRKEDLARDGRALAEELVRLDEQVKQARAEAEAARAADARVREAAVQGTVSREQAEDAERRPRVAEALLTQARAVAEGRHAEAASLYRRALAIFETALGRAHPHVAACSQNYSRLLAEFGRRAEARRLRAR
jgi:multidrug resistance efflux pump